MDNEQNVRFQCLAIASDKIGLGITSCAVTKYEEDDAIEAADKLAEFVMHGVGSDAEKRLSDFEGLLKKMGDAVDAQCAVSAAAGHADEYERALANGLLSAYAIMKGVEAQVIPEAKPAEEAEPTEEADTKH